MKTYTFSSICVLSLGLMAMPGVLRAQDPGAQRAQDPGVQKAQEHALEALPNPMQALLLMQNVGRTMFMAADVNHDGLLSEKEAIDANNTLIGGFFFQADKDGNGVVTQEEAREVQETYLSQNPWARTIVDALQAQQKNSQSNLPVDPIQSITALIDTNNDKQVQATEVRELVQTTTKSIFASGDTNRDGKMSESEIYAAMAGGVRSLAQFAFQSADTDNNGSLSRAEFDKAIVEPANVAFQILDQNHDGLVSQQEAQQSERMVINQLRAFQLPEPPNSPANLIESGRLPSEVAPVPTLATPTLNRVRQQTTGQPRQQSGPRSQQR